MNRVLREIFEQCWVNRSQPEDREWLESLRQVVDCIDTYGMLPKSDSILYRWISKQRLLFKDGTLPFWRRSLLERSGVPLKVHYSWEERFEQLVQWIEIHGRLPVSNGDAEECRINEWLRIQLSLEGKSKLQPERRKALQKEGLLAGSLLELKWNKAYAEVEHFIKVNDRLPSRESSDPVEVRLATWRHSRLDDMRKGRLSLERSERIRALHLGDSIIDRAWESRLKDLKAFIAKHNRQPSSWGRGRHEESLANWWQYQQARSRKGELTFEKEQKLYSISKIPPIMDWRWKRKFRDLQAWVRRKGELPKHNETDPHGYSLFLWQKGQRGLYMKGKLPKDKTDLLAPMGVFVGVGVDSWQVRFEAAVELFKRVPDVAMDNVKKEDRSILNWLKAQRTKARSGKLPQSKIEQLRASGLIGRTLEERWNDNLQRLAQFIKIHQGKYPSVNTTDQDEKYLALWWFRQRYRYHSLSAERQEQLRRKGIRMPDKGEK